MTDTPDDVVAFLTARLDDDEAAARAATPGPWRYAPEKYHRWQGTSHVEESVFAGPSGSDAVSIAGTGPVDDPQSMRDAAHIARHGPDKVLLDVRAKRAVIEEWEGATRAQQGDPKDISASIWALAVGLSLRHLAAAYDWHPGYRKEWAP